MKRLTFIATPLLAVFLFCIVSCNDADDDTNADTTAAADTSNNTNSAATTPASTIATTPQHMMVVRHKVSDFSKWLASYEANDSLRQANGVHSYVIGRSIKDSNMIQVSLKVDDINKAKAFAKDAALKQAMQKSGVIGAPNIRFALVTWQDTAQVNTDLRSRATFTAKDWARWQHSFDSSRQSGYDNGVVVRAYGHDVDDDRKVFVVTAIMDTAKANAYWKSDMLKKRREASGVSGEAERFIYRIAKRY